MATWMPIAVSNGMYHVSDMGEVRNAATGKIIRQRKDKDGYMLVDVRKGRLEKVTLKAHRVVAEAFLPNPEGKPEVNHLNAVRHDNRLANIEWSTVSENRAYSYKMGRGVGNERAIVGVKGDEVLSFTSLKEAERNGFNRNGIYHCINGVYKHHHGYEWRYAP
jgi:hypothetical protein